MKRFALVTGGTRGIGAVISEHLYELGYSVLAVYRKDEESASTLETKLAERGGEFHTRRLELCDGEAVGAFAAEVAETHGVPGLLVNNAGSILRPSYWRDQSLADAHTTVRENLDLTLNVVWAFAPLMAAAGTGRIVTISSTFASLGESHVLAYTAAKAGLHALTKGLAMDLGPNGVTANTISPAVVRTAMTDAASDGFIEASQARTPMRELATPIDIARCVAFLADNPMINGVDLVVDGGLHLLGP